MYACELPDGRSHMDHMEHTRLDLAAKAVQDVDSGIEEEDEFSERRGRRSRTTTKCACVSIEYATCVACPVSRVPFPCHLSLSKLASRHDTLAQFVEIKQTQGCSSAPHRPVLRVCICGLCKQSPMSVLA